MSIVDSIAFFVNASIVLPLNTVKLIDLVTLISFASIGSFIGFAIDAEPNAGRTSLTGSGNAVTHMNPFIAVYMWKRTS